MIVGYSGHLLSADFLEQRLSLDDTGAAEFRRALQRLRARAASLGPATGLRAMVDIVARPLFDLLQWRIEQSSIEPSHAVLTARADNAAVLIHVIPWAASLDRARHEAVVHARRTGADWTAVLNGTHLRLTRPLHLSSRRHADFDLELAADDAATAAALVALCQAHALGINQRPGSVLALMQASPTVTRWV